MYRLSTAAVIAVALLGLLPMHAVAEVASQPTMVLPAYYPTKFQKKGTIQNVEPKRQTLVINGARMRYDANLKVHTLATEFASVYDLRPGDAVGVNYLNNDRERRIISEVWVLPKGAVKEH